MDRRAYNEFCALAVALDHLGERWTLLVIRELLLGPKRYTDLRTGLPGIAANLLAARLRTLEEDGIVRRRRLPPPAASTIYELTERGRELEPVLLGLARWGSPWMTRPPEGSVVRASWFALALKSLVGPTELAGIRADFELVAGDETIHVHVASGRLEVDASAVAQPDARLIADAGTMFRIASGNASLGEEVAAGRAQVEGAQEQREALERTLKFP
jgi:DNA-binding HxlR family transcriptional regulator